jgi:hypothetical protein
MAVSPLDRRPKRALGTSLESLLSLTRYSLRAVTLALAPLLVSCTADGPADLVLLSGDPLADITNTRSVEAVISKGVFLSRAQLDGLVR